MGLVGPNDKENQVKMYTKYCTVLGTLPLEMVRIRFRIKQSDPDPCQNEKQDPDLGPYQSEKQDPDPYQKGLDPQH